MIYMGQYLQIGICTGIVIKNSSIRDYGYENIIKSLKKEIDIEMYDVYESDKNVFFQLKKEFLNKDDILDFLEKQFEMRDEDKSLIEKLKEDFKNFNEPEDIINYARKKAPYYFVERDLYKLVRVGIWNDSIWVVFKLIVFAVEGKIIIEQYNGFLKYMENIIRKDSSNKIAKTIKAIIM